MPQDVAEPGDGLVVRLLGDPEFRRGPAIVHAFSSPRLRSLLAYLVLGRDRPIGRQRLAFLFWPDSSEGQARTNLRQALYNLRHALGDLDGCVHVDHQTVQWIGDDSVDVDVVRFDVAARAGLDDGDEAALARAADLYRGELLEGCWDDWVLASRRRLRATAAAVLASLSDAAARRGEWRGAVAFGERLVQLDPLDESAYRRLIEVHAAVGDRGRAARVYHECVAVFDRELGVVPDAATVELYHTIVTDPLERSSADDGPALAAPAERPRLVGRDHELERLMAAWRVSAGGRPRVVLVTGEPGIGKSRLVEEFRTWCAHEGISVAWGRAYEAAGGMPYGPIVEILRSEVVGGSLAQLDRAWRRELGRLLPELSDTDPTPEESASARRRLFEAVARAVVAPTRRTVLAVDDVPWCDADSLELLEFVVRQGVQSSSQLLLVGTARIEELASQPRLRALIGRLHALEVMEELPLARLGDLEASSLARDVLGTTGAETVERLVGAAEGNPLFLVELARSGLIDQLPVDGRGEPIRLPPRMHTAIEARLDQLSHDARELASAAAVVGRAFRLDIVRAVTPTALDDVAAIDELWRRGIVREHGSDGYDFSHDKIREVAYITIGPARRRRLHAAVAAALQAAGEPGGAAQVAVHLEHAGQTDAAIAAHRRAVDEAIEVFAHQDVINSCRRALQLVAGRSPGPGRDDAELAFLIPLGVALMAGPGVSEGDHAVYERARVLRAERGLVPEPSTLRLSANAAIGRRDFHEARGAGRTLLDRGRHDDDAVLVTEGHYLIGVTSFWLGEIETSDRHLVAALASNRLEHTIRHLQQFGQDPRAVCQVRLALARFHLGHDEAAAELCAKAMATAAATGHHYTDVYVRAFAAWYFAERGDADRAALVVQGMPESDTSNAVDAVSRPMFAGWQQAQRGDPVAGVSMLEQAHRETRAGHRLLMHEPFVLLMLAQSHRLAGDVTAGRAVATAAQAIAAREMPFHLPEALRIHGELVLATGGSSTVAVPLLADAVRTAEQQGSVVHALRAHTSLLRALRRHQPAATAAQAKAVRAALDRFPASCTLPELAAARSVLEA